jgi:hypothetical protein
VEQSRPSGIGYWFDVYFLFALQMNKSEELANFQKYTRIYMAVSGVMQLIVIIFIAMAMVLPFSYPTDEYPYVYAPVFFALLYGLILIVLLTVISFHVFVAVWIGKPGRFVYYSALILLANGFSSILTIVPAVMLFAKLFDADIKAFYFQTKK